MRRCSAIYLECHALLEAPKAYKNIKDIIDDLKSFELALPVAQLKPIVNINP